MQIILVEPNFYRNMVSLTSDAFQSCLFFTDATQNFIHSG